MPLPLPAKLEDQRAHLIRYIEIHRPQGSLNNAVTIVFDGQPDTGGWPQTTQAFGVVFSQNETADDLIGRMVEQSSTRKSMVVVSDDRAVQMVCRSWGAQIRSVQDFMRFGHVRSQKMIRPLAAPNLEGTKIVSQKIQNQINDELSALWIRRSKKNS